MKQITLDKMLLMPKLLMSALTLLSLSVFSMHALAEQSEASQSGRDFNHITTGFPLTGLHATAECGSCHVGGVFKGTPRNCSGCHAKGRRVVATPMSAQHLVTTEPCEVCHSNTVTFYGAKYNHGKAVVGQCATCHNGIVAAGRAASHTSGVKATKSCDSCHRTYAWIPASWNHTSGGVCTSCHNWSTGVNTPVKANHTATTLECDQCHVQTGWLPATFRHSGATAGVCGTCHNGSTAKGTSSISLHIPVTASGNACDNCHSSMTSFATWSMNHASNGNTTSCNACHASTAPAYPPGLTRKTIGSHEGSKAGQDCYSCHNKGINWKQ